MFAHLLSIYKKQRQVSISGVGFKIGYSITSRFFITKFSRSVYVLVLVVLSINAKQMSFYELLTWSLEFYYMFSCKGMEALQCFL